MSSQINRLRFSCIIFAAVFMLLPSASQALSSTGKNQAPGRSAAHTGKVGAHASTRLIVYSRVRLQKSCSRRTTGHRSQSCGPIPSPTPTTSPSPAPAPAPTPEPSPTPESPTPIGTTPQPIADSGAIPAGAYYVSTTGSDSNPGTLSSPWKTLAKAVATVQPGDTVVLRSGTYGARGTVNLMNRAGTASAPITYRGYPGEPAPRILGFFKITAGFQRFSGFLFDGPTGSVKAPTSENPTGEEVQVSVIGTDVSGIEISHSEIRNSLWHAGLFLQGAFNARIVGDYVHNNGDVNDPGQANMSHGIYWSSGSGLIADDVITGNVARGVQLYPNPQNVVVTNSTMVGNGKAGIQIADQAADCTVVNNIVSRNGSGIRSASLTGTGDVVQNNLVWQNSSGDLAPFDGLTLSDNLVADPRFVGTTDYGLASDSPAIDRSTASYAPSSDFTGLATPLGAGRDLGAYESH